ncbi:MAG: hypothetical protein KGZ86_03790 [Candidatus Latescibacteria bacterium]|nr:hypothetical protein [Candidatus Latescibacterota bacterium]
MPVRPTLRRMQKLEANYDPDAIRDSLQRQRESILEQQKTKQAELEKIENSTKLLIGDESVLSTLYVSYLNFARQIWKLKNTYTSGTLKIEADIMIYKWTRRGLDENILKRIRNEIFTLQAPAP